MNLTNDNELWDAINRYAMACGGDPSSCGLHGNTMLKAAIADIRRLTEDAEPDVQMTDLSIEVHEGGPFHGEARFKGEAVKAFAASAVEWFRECKGDNFVTVDLVDPSTHECYSITMQRAGGKTPAQIIAELRAGESEAWLFHCWTPGKHCTLATVDENDTSWWPADQWKGVTRVPLVTQGEPTLIHGELPPKEIEVKSGVCGCKRDIHGRIHHEVECPAYAGHS